MLKRGGVLTLIVVVALGVILVGAVEMVVIRGA